MDARWQTAAHHRLHLFMEHARLALHDSPQIDAEMNESVKLRRSPEPFLLHPVQIFEAVDNIDRQPVDMTYGIAGAQ